MTAQLNDLESFPLVTSRAKAIGFRVLKVVYRGYLATPEMQAIHDNAIKSASALKQLREEEQQRQSIEDLKLARALERSEKEREMGTDIL